MPHATSPEFIREFADSMPDGYRDRHDALAVAAHARVAHARDGRPAHVGIVGQGAPGEAAVCVVARDRPGLLSTISAAFVLSGMDVMAAEAFTRRPAGGNEEAVDLFWIRRNRPSGKPRPITDEDADAIGGLLLELLEGRVPGAATREQPEELEPARPTDTTVRFLDDKGGGLVTLEVETDDRSGLLLALSGALFEQRVQIVRSEVKTVQGRVFDRFAVVEFDGSPISPARRLEIQVAVLTAVEPTNRPRPSALSQNA
jgi:[protein-PII] uridylyltransferase